VLELERRLGDIARHPVSLTTFHAQMSGGHSSAGAAVDLTEGCAEHLPGNAE
jgi:hypothetical protein